MKWVYYKDYKTSDALVGEKFGIRIYVLSQINNNFDLNKKQTPIFTIYCKENGKEIQTYSNVSSIDFNKTITSTSDYSIDVNNGSETKNISFT